MLRNESSKFFRADTAAGASHTEQSYCGICGCRGAIESNQNGHKPPRHCCIKDFVVDYFMVTSAQQLCDIV